jgi:hypothetical protein
MRRMLRTVLLATLGFASAVHGASALPVAAEGADQFSVVGIKVDATALSPRAARELAIAQGRPIAWSQLFRRFTGQPAWGTEPQLGERELLGLILSSDAGNERRNTTRYLADVTFHFNPAAVRQLLRRSNIVFTGATMNAAGEWEQSADLPISAIEDATTHLAVNVRFDTLNDWTTLRARLGAAKAITGMDVVDVAPNEAQIYLTYSGDVEHLHAALAEHALDLTSSEGEFTLELDAVSEATTASLQ